MKTCTCGIYNPTWAHMRWHYEQKRRQERAREAEEERDHDALKKLKKLMQEGAQAIECGDI